ncbi:MAG TPA: STAS domain-containing protein [Armatimonadota bacterium]|nr:STAS domain-containing protein [Armatimonadota bacterium]
MKQLESGPGAMHIDVETLGEAVVISPKGACDDHCAEVLESIIKQIEEKPHQTVILDASKLQYIETPGFRLIIKQFRKLQELGGMLIVAGLCGPAERAFRLLQLDKYIPAVANVEAALARVRREPEQVAK